MLVDEAQDANPVQVEWVRLLTSVHGGLTVVGDEDQNIYGFQGGYPGAMSDMTGPAAARFNLVTNRRCTEEILKPANMSVEFNRRSEPKVLTSGRHGAPVRTLHFSNNLQEADALGREIKALIDSGEKPGEIAVLARSHYVVGPIEEGLLRHGVGALVSRGGSLLEREEVKDLASFLRLSINPHDEMAFRRIANKPKRGLGVAGVDAICRLADARSIPFHEACHEIVDGAGRSKLRKDAREGAAELGRTLTIVADDGAYGRSPLETLEFVLDDGGYLAWIESQNNPEGRLDNVDVIKRLAEEREDTVDLLNEITLLTDVESFSGKADRVVISTIHASKGLEFDHVFCPAFDENVIPNPMAVESGRRGKPGNVWNGPNGGGIDEERRLAHVAFTRARHTLTVSFPWQRTFPGKSTPIQCGPSSILAECELDYEAAIETERAGRRRRRRNRSRAGFGSEALD
jgi:DNA helicase-2/ATP-dependent DNA helicase PcrA